LARLMFEPDTFKIRKPSKTYKPNGARECARRMRQIAKRQLKIVVVLLLAAPAAQAHDWYTGLKNAFGGDCCGREDWRPAEPGQIRINERGDLEVQINMDSRWESVPEYKVLRDRSEDGQSHICASVNQLYCLILPKGM